MFSDPFLNHLAIAMVIIAGSTILGRVFKSLADVVGRHLVAKTATTLDDRILSVVESKIVVLSLLAGISIGIREVRKGLTAENVTHHEILDYLSIALFVALVLVIGHMLSRFFKTMVEWYTDSVAIKTHTNIAPTVVPFTTKLVNIVLFFIMGIVILDHFGVNIGGLLVSLGVGSLAIALAAQETIANMIAWFVILIDQPVRIGDRIKLPTGEEGDVFQIGLRSTRILNLDNNLVIIPNGELVKSRIVNLSAPDISTTVIVEVNVTYGTNVEQARAIMLELIQEQPDVQTEPPPQVYLTSLGDVGMQLKLVGRTPDVIKKFRTETILREQIYKRFRESGIEIPSVQRFVQARDPNAVQAAQKK